MPEPDLDRRIRLEAFEHVLSLKSLHKTLPWEEIGRGFDFEGEKVHLSNRASGIHKPKQMDTLLSIRTARPRRGRQHWYEDQRQIQHEIFGEREYWNYSLMRGSPTLWRNRLLEEAYEQRTPIIYFLGVEPALYEPIVPAFIYSFDPIGRNCLVGPGDLRNTVEQVIDQRPFDSASERRYYMRETQQRAHQSIFRAAVLHAYRHRCAVTGLTVPRLLDAAHIVEDRHETLGQPVVPNGLPLSKIHHAAFDANLISIDPDYRIHISERLLDENDGPLLELLKQADGNRIYLPRQNPHDRPCAHPDGMKQTDAASARPLPVRSCNVEFENRVRSPYLGISGRLRAINRGCPDRRGVSTFGERTSHGGRSWQLSV